MADDDSNNGIKYKKPPNLIGVVLKTDNNGKTMETRAGIIRGTLAKQVSQVGEIFWP